MKMENVEDVVEETSAVDSEQKMLKLMAEMQAQAQAQVPENKIPTLNDNNTSNNIGVSIKPDTNVNYWDIDDIPTKYRLYPEGTKLSARPLKVLEIKKLTSINEMNADSVVNDILRKCVRGIDINEIYSADKMYLLLWLRANSFRDNNYVVGYVCPLCNTESSYHFDINNIEIDYLSDNYDPNKLITFSNGDEVKVKLLQIKDEIATTSFINRYSSLFENTNDGIDDELLALSFMIEYVNGVEMDPLQKYNYILDMNPGDFAALTTRLQDTTVGIKQVMNVTCNECGGESQLGITFQPDFFLPRYQTK